MKISSVVCIRVHLHKLYVHTCTEASSPMCGTGYSIKGRLWNDDFCRQEVRILYLKFKKNNFCVKMLLISSACLLMAVACLFRYSRHDKRSKLPSWILSHLRDAHLNLSTDMAVHIAREVSTKFCLCALLNAVYVFY